VLGVVEKNGNIFKYYWNSIKIYESSQVYTIQSAPTHQPLIIRISYNNINGLIRDYTSFAFWATRWFTTIFTVSVITWIGFGYQTWSMMSVIVWFFHPQRLVTCRYIYVRRSKISKEYISCFINPIFSNML